MASVLHLSENDSIRRESFSALDRRINANDSGYTLSTANALWVDGGFSLLEGYKTLVENTYHGRANNLDFRAAPEEARQTINDWVEQKTAGKITDLIPTDYVKSLTRLVLTNAIYFNGTWMKKFDQSLTMDEDFFTEDGRKVPVPMMRQANEKAWFNYLERRGLQVLEMPYAGGNLSMLILLPHDQDIASLERSLSSEELDQWRDSLVEQRVDVYMPRFKLKANYFLAEILSDLGMPTAFNNETADFSGLSPGRQLFINEVIHQAYVDFLAEILSDLGTPTVFNNETADFSGSSPGRQLFISGVIHQAYVDVNEHGTEAAAATAVGMCDTSGGPWEPDVPVFRADHPFIFLILDDETGCILFLGRVSDPSKG
jgi:serpin B